MRRHALNRVIEETLRSYFMAFYPLIHIFSYEEDRVEYYLEKITSDLVLNLFEWDIIDGFKKVEGDTLSKVKDSNIVYR